MLARVFSSALHGIDATIVEVEIDIARGLPNTQIVGLPEAAVRESRERVRAAMRNSGYRYPSARTTINLAPADLRKEGSAYDLPIAVGLLAADGQIPVAALSDHLILGELSLDGRVKAVRGALSVAVSAAVQSFPALIVPLANAAEAALVPGIDVYGIDSLGAAVELLGGRLQIEPTRIDVGNALASPAATDLDLAEVRGQAQARRAMEVAAAGGHNLLFFGPPGSGKTMLARRLATILPAMTLDEALEATRIHSVAGLLDGHPLVTARPFRAPHHTVSHAGMAGGGSWPRPGEASLAHNGVLFLDELPEFPRRVLEVLRQPLEERRITVSRALGSVTFPASFLLIAAMNPCKCGYYGDPRRECACPPGEIARYRGRVSGPLLDRIDLHVEVPAVAVADLAADRNGEPSAIVRARVEQAGDIQRERFGKRKIRDNARMSNRDVQRWCSLDPGSSRLLGDAIERLGLSARAYHRILKVARTIADLEGAEALREGHVAEAIQYRALDRDQG